MLPAAKDFEYPKLKVESPNVKYTLDEADQAQVESLYEYEHVRVDDSQPNTVKVTRRPIYDPRMITLMPTIGLTNLFTFHAF